MNLQNGYKVIYEQIADGKRTFYATKNVTCDPSVDDKIVEAAIGEYKLIYEKDGQFYGSMTGIPTENDYCFVDFDKVFKATPAEEPKENNTTTNIDETNGPTFDLPILEEEEEE